MVRYQLVEDRVTGDLLHHGRREEKVPDYTTIAYLLTFLSYRSVTTIAKYLLRAGHNYGILNKKDHISEVML
jgi:hypothetical protein